jgi:hypothetical protein
VPALAATPQRSLLFGFVESPTPITPPADLSTGEFRAKAWNQTARGVEEQKAQMAADGVAARLTQDYFDQFRARVESTRAKWMTPLLVVLCDRRLEKHSIWSCGTACLLTLPPSLETQIAAIDRSAHTQH